MRRSLWPFLFIIFSFSLHANEFLRPQRFSNFLEPPKEDQAHPLTQARVAYLNEVALKRDFPDLQQLTNEDLKNWILDQCALMTIRQKALQNIRNSQIPQNTKIRRRIFRLRGWNRAALVEVQYQNQSIGFIDVKGIGYGNLEGFQKWNSIQSQIKKYKELRMPYVTSEDLSTLRNRDHSDGLMSLGEAIAELTRQQAIQNFYETVETYAIIDTGFDILKGDSAIPAGLYLRQAHQGRNTGLVGLDNIYLGKNGGYQHTFSGTAVDFGAVQIVHPTYAFNFGPRLPARDLHNPQEQKPWSFGHEVATQFRQRGGEHTIYEHLDSMLKVEVNTLKSPQRIFISNFLEDDKAYLQKAQESLARPFNLETLKATLDLLSQIKMLRLETSFFATRLRSYTTLARNFIPLIVDKIYSLETGQQAEYWKIFFKTQSLDLLESTLHFFSEDIRDDNLNSFQKKQVMLQELTRQSTRLKGILFFKALTLIAVAYEHHNSDDAEGKTKNSPVFFTLVNP